MVTPETEPDQGRIIDRRQLWLPQPADDESSERRPPELNLAKDALFEWETHCAN